MSTFSCERILKATFDYKNFPSKAGTIKSRFIDKDVSNSTCERRLLRFLKQYFFDHLITLILSFVFAEKVLQTQNPMLDFEREERWYAQKELTCEPLTTTFSLGLDATFIENIQGAFLFIIVSLLVWSP